MKSPFPLSAAVFLAAMSFASPRLPAATRGEAPADSVAARAGDTVVLVHGLQWFSDTLKPTAAHLADQGYHVVRFTYDSRGPLEPTTLAEQMDLCIRQERAASNRPIHFVAHSMGCIVVRSYLEQRRPTKLGRVVFLAPPNKGTELADLVARSRLLQSIFGRGAPCLSCQNGLPAALPKADYGPGVIMGSRSAFPMISPFLPGADDGVITVENGRLEGMADFLVVAATHTKIPCALCALRQVDHFLREGKFEHQEAAKEAESSLLGRLRQALRRP